MINYVMNTSGFDLWVISYDRYYNNRTRGLRAIIPCGEWFITNSVFEDHGYVRDECRLNIAGGKWYYVSSFSVSYTIFDISHMVMTASLLSSHSEDITHST